MFIGTLYSGKYKCELCQRWASNRLVRSKLMIIPSVSFVYPCTVGECCVEMDEPDLSPHKGVVVQVDFREKKRVKTWDVIKGNMIPRLEPVLPIPAGPSTPPSNSTA